MSDWFLPAFAAACAFVVLIGVLRWFRWTQNEARAERRFLAEVEAHNRKTFQHASMADAMAESVPDLEGAGLTPAPAFTRARRP